jgi:hypothetical protein
LQLGRVAQHGRAGSECGEPTDGHGEDDGSTDDCTSPSGRLDDCLAHPIRHDRSPQAACNDPYSSMGARGGQETPRSGSLGLQAFEQVEHNLNDRRPEASLIEGMAVAHSGGIPYN